MPNIPKISFNEFNINPEDEKKILKKILENIFLYYLTIFFGDEKNLEKLIIIIKKTLKFALDHQITFDGLYKKYCPNFVYVDCSELNKKIKKEIGKEKFFEILKKLSQDLTSNLDTDLIHENLLLDNFISKIATLQTLIESKKKSKRFK